MSVVKLYPGWKEAQQRILARVQAEGYGVLLSFEELFALMDIKQPERASAQEWQKHQFEVLQSIESLKKALLEENNLCLHNVRGQGYQALHPDDQVTVAIDRDYRKIGQLVCRIVKKAVCVNREALSFDGQQAQMRQLEKAAFLQTAMGKKKKLTSGGLEGGIKVLPE